MNRQSWKMLPKAGNLEHLKLVQEEIPYPTEEEVQIEVKAIGLNFADVFAIFGLYSATPKGEFIPGLEYAGIIKSVGPKVKHFKPGDRVMGATRFGAYTTHLNIASKYINRIPESWTFEQGASFIVQGLTAYYALVSLGNLQKGQTVLIHSAAGGVGLLANRIAKKYDAFTIGVVGNPGKLRLLKEEGYDVSMVRSNDFLLELTKQLEGRKPNIVLECIGGNIFLDSYKAMAKEGRLITYGSAQYAQPGKKPNYPKLIWQYIRRPKLDVQKMIESNKSVMGFNLIYLYDNPERLREVLNELLTLDLEAPFVGHTFAFDEMHEALHLFQSGKTTGKVVVTI